MFLTLVYLCDGSKEARPGLVCGSQSDAERGGSLLACHEKLVCLPLVICSGLRPRQRQKEALLRLLPVRCRDQLEHGEQQEN